MRTLIENYSAAIARRKQVGVGSRESTRAAHALSACLDKLSAATGLDRDRVVQLINATERDWNTEVGAFDRVIPGNRYPDAFVDALDEALNDALSDEH